MSKRKRTWDVILIVVMVLLCLLWIYPIVLILLNSLKTEGSFTTSTVFRLPTAETFAGLRNYVYGVTKMDFLSSMGYSLLITITSVVLILLCSQNTDTFSSFSGSSSPQLFSAVYLRTLAFEIMELSSLFNVQGPLTHAP